VPKGAQVGHPGRTSQFAAVVFKNNGVSSTCITSLSFVPIVHAEILDACKLQLRDCDELKSLKKTL